MTEQWIAAVHNSCNSVLLVFPQSYFGIYPVEGYMAAVILTGTDRVKPNIVDFTQVVTPFGVFPYPILKGLLDWRLLLLSDGGFLDIQLCNLVTVFILNIIKDTHITQIKRILNNFISADTACTIGVGSLNALIGALALNIPLTRKIWIFDLDFALRIIIRRKKLKHKLLDILFGYPSRAELYGNFTRR